MSTLKEKYNCPICQNILEDPMMTTKCFHIFCEKCIKSFINANLRNKPYTIKFNCPICRQEFGKDDYVLAFDLQMEIENCKLTCKKCGVDIPIRLFEDHIETCGKYKKDDGTIIGNYKCTLCPKTRMNRAEYVKHIEEQHSNEIGVCAICSVQPWGDKNYKTNLIGHVNLRHKKDIVYKNDYNELEILKQVMLKSMTEK